LTVFQLEFTIEAIDDLKVFRKFDQERILAAIETQLPTQAATPSRNRKPLRPNRLSEWELRIGEFRVFYDVHAPLAIVTIKALGEKVSEKLFIRGREFEL
jgi:mRNA-degrading endonuclease RelE of RelBE toxin-antitoxin system